MTYQMTTSPESPEGRKQSLGRDLKNIVDDADKLLGNVVNSAADDFAQGRDRVAASLNQAKSRLQEAGSNMSDRTRCAVDASGAYVRDNPWKIVGIAAATGLLLGAMIRRR